MKKLGRRLLTLLVIIILLVGIFILVKPNVFKTTTDKSSEISLIQDRLVELSEWTTLKYEYSNVIVSRTEKNISMLGIKAINYGEAIRLIEYSGYLKAGIDLSEIKISYDETSKALTVEVPKSKILDNVVETEKTKVEDVKGNLFSDYPTQIVFDEINSNKKQLEEEKISQGFLEEADKRISLLLSSFLEAYDYNKIIIRSY